MSSDIFDWLCCVLHCCSNAVRGGKRGVADMDEVSFNLIPRYDEQDICVFFNYKKNQKEDGYDCTLTTAVPISSSLSLTKRL